MATPVFQLPTYTITGEISHQYLPRIRIQCSNFVEIEQFLPVQEAMGNYNKTQVSPQEPTKLAIHSILQQEEDLIPNIGQNFKNTVSFDDILHFIDKENIVSFLNIDCGFHFDSGIPTKSDRSTENGTTFPDPVKDPIHSQQGSTELFY